MLLSACSISQFVAVIAPELTVAESDPPGFGRPSLLLKFWRSIITDLLRRKSSVYPRVCTYKGNFIVPIIIGIIHLYFRNEWVLQNNYSMYWSIIGENRHINEVE